MSPEDLWKRARVLRALAVRRPKGQSIKLYAMAHAKESEALAGGWTPPVEGKGPRTETAARTTVPHWFRKAARALRCTVCSGRASVWWYANGRRVRVAGLAVEGKIEAVTERIAGAQVLCRSCATNRRKRDD